MEWQAKFSYSKVARRIFGLFIVSALLPVIALSLISFRQVSRQLDDDSQQELRQTAKSEGMAIYERLRLLDSDMVQAAADGIGARGRFNSGIGAGLAPDTRDLFRGLGVLGPRGVEPLFGHVNPPFALSVAQEQHLASGRSLLLMSHCGGPQVCMQMLRYVDVQHPSRGLLIGNINIDNLLGAETLPRATRLCVLDDGGQTIFCPAQEARVVRFSTGRASSGVFDWQESRTSYQAGYWKLFLKPTFEAPEWTFILSKTRTDLLAQARNFGRNFLIVILLSLLIVVLLTLVQIRRSMVPLHKLQRAIQRTAEGRFDTQVEIRSGDEFQQLADGFNQMTSDLGKQFRALEAVGEVDRAILSALSSEKIVKTVLERIRAFLPYQAVSITLLAEGETNKATTYAPTAGDGDGSQASSILSSEEMKELRRQSGCVRLDVAVASRSYLASLVERGMKWFLVLPIRHEQGLLGVLVLGHPAPPVESPDDRVYAIQLADRLAVALSNARLVEELANLNLGTFTALARAIDAKSQWTSGHAERVTKMAVDIGRELGLPEKELRILHRGGLLHDIGKIGTPAAILDKPGKLTDEEFHTMQQHVTTGARILEPIPGFGELIPIVLQHHERFDGSGYPDGLAGEEISLHARIFAVADVYDALISERPYRSGWAEDRVLAFIQEQSGTHFDPRVVEGFFALMRRRKQQGGEGPSGAQDEAEKQAGGLLRRAQCAG